jgi:hypothetical protein
VVSFGVSLGANGQKVWSVGNDVSFDTHTPIAATADGEPDCSVNAQTDKEGMFAFQPQGCSPGPCERVRALIIGLQDLNPIPGDMVLYTCNVRIEDSAPPGRYPLVISQTDGSTTDGTVLSVIGTDGEIVVRP